MRTTVPRPESWKCCCKVTTTWCPHWTRCPRLGHRATTAVSWTASADAASYKLYRAVGNAPDYELIASDIADTDFVYKASDLTQVDQMTLKVTALRADGRESDEGATVVRLLP